MPLPLPSAEVVRSRPWQVALGVTVAAVVFGFAGVIRELVTLWSTKADYSHGFLLVPFIAYLLWTRRDLFPDTIRWPDPWGVPLLIGAAGMVVAVNYYHPAREFRLGLALVLAFAGVVVLFLGGKGGLRWAWPALLFPPFAFQLPYRIEQGLGTRLQGFATDAGNFVFQLLGLASYTEGNVIVIGDARLFVDEACGGLSMLLTFVALTAAIAVLYRSRPVIDRAVLFASAIPIALLCNVVRITVTGLVYWMGWNRLGDLVVHDLAGWLMMPLALGMLWLELKVIDWVVEPVERVGTGEALNLPGRRPAAAGPRP